MGKIEEDEELNRALKAHLEVCRLKVLRFLRFLRLLVSNASNIFRFCSIFHQLNRN
jgi:hypothetical protein